MAELIAAVILIISILGMVAILFRKLPVLVTLPEILPPPKITIGQRLKEKIKTLNPFKNFSYELFLQKILSKIRILTLKTENKTFNWLQKLRERTKKKKSENDHYWEEIKKIQKEKGKIKK